MAHRWVKVPNEWIPDEPGPDGTPGGAMDQIEALESEWKGIWRYGDLKEPEANFLQSLPMDDPPEPPEPQELRRVLGKFKKRTAVGACRWPPSLLKSLCDDGLRVFGLLLHMWEKFVCLPEQIMLLILPFLQKPEGGRRPIGILPTPVRVLGRLRHREAERWE